jgi:4-amino-4-deoxy-L-arabinose transferase-like glycosyltransferase
VRLSAALTKGGGAGGGDYICAKNQTCLLPVAFSRTLERALAATLLVGAFYPVQFSVPGAVLSLAVVLVLGLGHRFRRHWQPWVQARLSGLRLRGILLLALLLRLLFVGLGDPVQFTDYADFEQLARQMAEGRVFMDPGRPPGPSWLSALCFRYLGGHIYGALLPQLLLSLGHLCLVRALGAAFFGRALGNAAALLLALNPEHLLYANYICTENGYFFFLHLALWLLWRFRALEPQPGAAALLGGLLAGLSLGLAHVFRATAPIFVVALALALWPALRWRIAGRLLPLLAGFLLAVSPVLWFNRQVLGIWSLSSYQMGGWSLYLGSNPRHMGLWNAQDVADFEAIAEQTPLPPTLHPAVARDRLAARLGWERMVQHPANWVAAALLFKPYHYWGQPNGLWWAYHHFADRPLALLAWRLLFVLFLKALLFGAALALWRGPGAAFQPAAPRWMWRFMLYFALLALGSHLFLEVQGRYHHIFLGWLSWLAALRLLLRAKT